MGTLAPGHYFLSRFANFDRAGLVDFAELLLRAHELWLHNDDLLAHYRQRLQHILVDEFQDTSPIQLAIFPGSVTGFMRDWTYARASSLGRNSFRRRSHSSCPIPPASLVTIH